MMMNSMTAAFEGTPIDIVIVGSERWVRGQDVTRALGFADPVKAMEQLLKRNRSEFDASTTCVVDLPVAGQMRSVRLYNARGAALIAMKANTPKGEAFRRWVLDVLEGKAEVEAGPVRAATDMSATVANRLRTMFIEYPKMRQLVRYRTQGLNSGEIAKLLDVARGYVSAQLRVAEYLGLIEVDPKLEAYRASPQYQKFIQAKADYYQRKKARQAASAALPAPAASTEGQDNG